MARRYFKHGATPDDIVDWLNDTPGRRGIATLFASEGNSGLRWWIVWEETE